MLEASADEACLAVRLYNDPQQARSFEAFVVHMHMAWLYLLHAEMTRDKIDFRYRDKANPRRFVKVDGEFKQWELAKCVEYRWADAADPVRANLDFFISLRNKIEHRYARQQETLALALGGHAQALLLNYEEETTSQFGLERSLATRLRFPIFVGTFTTEGEAALRKLRSSLPKGLRRFIADYHAGLGPKTGEDRRFEFRMRVTLELAARDPEATAVQFTRLDEMTPEQQAAVEQMGRKGQVIVREQQRPVVNLGWVKPVEAARKVEAQIPYVFNRDHFRRSWKRGEVRPPTGSEHPERTKEQFCAYDEAHGDYVYSPVYIKYLAKHCATEDGFRETTGRVPQPRKMTKADLQAS
ncbi:MAG: hypothetical protein JWN77_1589 [Frankiales bacterium]|nr:hypothetical protein [Frankiales bacterium]